MAQFDFAARSKVQRIIGSKVNKQKQKFEKENRRKRRTTHQFDEILPFQQVLKEFQPNPNYRNRGFPDECVKQQTSWSLLRSEVG